jgi:hypothetical protein|tara:strand:- start:203 stop:655 length:453 start_codon:yes stop_codon:yes gene_type:complete
MITYKITTPHNGCIQYTQTGNELYCSILDKFNIEYKIEEITPTKENDIPHSEIRRMESEGVLEKFDESNPSTPKYFNEEWNQSSTDDNIIPNYVEDEERMNIIGQNGNDGLHYDKVKSNSDFVDEDNTEYDCWNDGTSNNTSSGDDSNEY